MAEFIGCIVIVFAVIGLLVVGYSFWIILAAGLHALATGAA